MADLKVQHLLQERAGGAPLLALAGEAQASVERERGIVLRLGRAPALETFVLEAAIAMALDGAVSQALPHLGESARDLGCLRSKRLRPLERLAGDRIVLVLQGAQTFSHGRGEGVFRHVCSRCDFNGRVHRRERRWLRNVRRRFGDLGSLDCARRCFWNFLYILNGALAHKARQDGEDRDSRPQDQGECRQGLPSHSHDLLGSAAMPVSAAKRSLRIWRQLAYFVSTEPFTPTTSPSTSKRSSCTSESKEPASSFSASRFIFVCADLSKPSMVTAMPPRIAAYPAFDQPRPSFE